MLDITDKEFRNLADFIRENYGIFLKDEKKGLVITRLHQVLDSKNFKSFSEYYDYLLSDKTGEAVITLINKITTNHTFFMRESAHFEYFKTIVLPFMVKTIRDRDIRIWSAACSSGEESYTLAMIIDEFFGNQKSSWDTKILATDISEKVLAAARAGIYESERIEPLPDQWKANYFRKYDPENFIVCDKIRNEVIYRKLNLIETVFPFKKKFHVIFCRNVMIYFDNPTRDELIEKFYRGLEDGGYLFIGLSESINRDRSRFKYMAPSIYRKE